MTPAGLEQRHLLTMIRNLSETVIVPIAGIILTFVMCYELIQLIDREKQPARCRHLDVLQVDFQDLLCGADCHEHLEHCHGVCSMWRKAW